MVTATKSKTKNKKISSNIWLLTVLGVLLLLLTTGLLAVRLQAITELGQNGTDITDGTALSQTVTLPSQPITIDDETDKEWSLATKTVDLFKSSYQNANGDVTVESADGKKLIAPGTSGSYTFALNNTGSTELEYKLWLEKSFKVTTSNGETVTLPVQIRFSSGTDGSKSWYLGSGETVWISAATLDDIEEDEAISDGIIKTLADGVDNIEELAYTSQSKSAVTGKLNGNQSRSFTLEWQWPFDSGVDENDLLLGNSENAEFTLKLIIVAETEEDAVLATNLAEEEIIENPKSEMSLGEKAALGTGGALLLLLLLLLLLFRRITLSGYLLDSFGKPMAGYKLYLEQSGIYKTKETELEEDGYFLFRHIPLGKKSLVLKNMDGQELARNELRLRRRGKLRISDFLQIQEKQDDSGLYTVLDMRYRISGIEVYVYRGIAPRMEIEDRRWLAYTWLRKEYTPDVDE